MGMLRAEDGFRRLTLGDPGLIAMITGAQRTPTTMAHLDARTEALVRIAALIALDAPPSSYRSAVEAADRAGAQLDDLLAILIAVADTVGSARLVSAAPRIALAAGYDVEAELERLEGGWPRTDASSVHGG